MGIQAMFFGGIVQSTITAQSSVASDTGFSQASAYIRFTSGGLQAIETFANGQSIIGSWVMPNSSAPEWEIRATLASGDTPSGVLGTWQALTIDRVWGFNLTSSGTLSCALTFEFRPVGSTDAQVSIPGNSIFVEAVGAFRV